MKIVTAGGGTVIFTAAVLFALTSGAAPGDAVYAVIHEGSADVLTGPQKALLGTAVEDVAPGVVKANIDALSCWTRNEKRALGVKSKAGAITPVTYCGPYEETTPTAQEEWDADFNGGAGGASATSGHRKRLGPFEVTDLAPWNAFTQAVWGVDIQQVYGLSCSRPDPGDKTVIECMAQLVKTGTVAEYVADKDAGNVVKPLEEVQ